MTAVPVGCELFVDGVRFADGATGGDVRAPIALDQLRISWGRSTTVDQPEPAACTVQILDRGAGSKRVDQSIRLGSALTVWAVLGASRVIVFVGRVTDLELSYEDDQGGGGAVCQVIATDLMGDLANRFVGSEPWPMETIAARAARIMTAIGQSVTVTVDDRPKALSVSRLDVDRQPAANLLRELATTGTAVLWVVVDTAGTVSLRIEDPTARSGLWILGKGGDGFWRPMQGTESSGGQLDTSQVLRAPVRWNRATADLITRVTVRWLDQSTSPGTTERTVGVVDAAAEAQLGARGLSVGTILTSSADATAAANLLLATHQASDLWRASGLEWDLAHSVADDDDTRALALHLLDNTTRIGAALLVGVMPAWAPGVDSAIGLYCDGGEYEFVGGRWRLTLLTTASTGTGKSFTYVQTPREIQYAQMAHDVSYLDLVGVAAPSASQPTVRTNQATSPRPVSGRGWTTTRGFQSGGTGAGTYSFPSSPTPPPGFVGNSTVCRKSWTTASTAPGNVGFLVYDTATDYFAVTPGDKLAVAGWMRRIGGTSTAKTFVLRVTFWTSTVVASATQVGGTTSGSGVQAPAVNSWILIGNTVTVPAGAFGMAVYLDTASNADPGFGVGDGLDAGGVIIEKADAVTTYFDGSFTSTATLVYAWAGTVNASTSTETKYPVVGELVPASRARGEIEQQSHNNAYGFPVPDPTDPYYKTPNALAALKAAIEPKLVNAPMQFIPGAQYSTDANGEVLVDLSTRFTAITAAIVSDEGPSAWDAKYYQMVTRSGDPAGRLRIRALTLRPPDGTVVASNVVRFAIVVWGTPK
jgi:hypothetical protein